MNLAHSEDPIRRSVSRRTVLSATCAWLAGGLAEAGAGAAAAAEATGWTLATGYPESSFHVVNLRDFAGAVEQASGGKLKIQVHAGGSLIKAAEIRAALDQGRIEAGELFGPSLGALHPALALDALPFLATTYADAKRLDSVARGVIGEQLARNGYVLLYSVPWPPQGLFAGKPIESVADLAGLRIRENSPVLKRMIELLGARPVRVETPELAAAVRAQQVDAVFTSAAQGIDAQLWRQLPYFYTANAWLPRNVVLARKKAFETLDPALREALLKAAAGAQLKGEQLSEDSARSTLEQLRRAGAKIEVPSTAVRQRLDRVGEKVAQELAASQKTPELLDIQMKYFGSK